MVAAFGGCYMHAFHKCRAHTKYGFYAIKNQGWVSFRGERVTQRPAKDWFVSYVRARCINAFESLDPFRES